MESRIVNLENETIHTFFNDNLESIALSDGSIKYFRNGDVFREMLSDGRVIEYN